MLRHFYSFRVSYPTVLMLSLLFISSLVFCSAAQDTCADVERPVVLVSRPEGKDYFAVQLQFNAKVDNSIKQWSVTNEEGEILTPALTPEMIFNFTPTDCAKTSYRVSMRAQCSDDKIYEIELETVTMEPIPINDMASFVKADYNQLRGQGVNEGDRVTLTCQTQRDAERLYDFQPTYTWFKLDNMARNKHKNQIFGPSTSNVYVIDSVSCKDAGHYFCKIRRCNYHTKETKACNNNDLAVVLKNPPPVTTSKCRIFGDPHVITFDGAKYNYRGHCWYVLAMDKVKYKWFVYGYFAPCGKRSHCLETVSVVARTKENPRGTQVQLFRGYGMSLQGEKVFIRRNTVKKFNGAEMLFKGNYMLLEVPEFGLKIKWDGLIAATIYVDKDTPTMGICGDNDGDDSNDLSSFYDGKDRTSDAFVDAWSLGQSSGCLLSGDVEERVDAVYSSVEELLANSMANPNYMPTFFQKSYCSRTLFGFESGQESQLASLARKLPQETVDYFIDACVHDTKYIDYGWFNTKYSQFAGCGAAHMMAEEAEEAGVCIDEWHRGSQCPSRKLIREESIRIGCIWTGEDWEIVSW